jgi:hypothetical protein
MVVGTCCNRCGVAASIASTVVAVPQLDGVNTCMLALVVDTSRASSGGISGVVAEGKAVSLVGLIGVS